MLLSFAGFEVQFLIVSITDVDAFSKVFIKFVETHSYLTSFSKAELPAVK